MHEVGVCEVIGATVTESTAEMVYADAAALAVAVDAGCAMMSVP
jgi:hypothetical protein